MLPVVAGAKETRRQIVLYTLLLVPLSLVPWALGFCRPGLRRRRRGPRRRVSRQRLARAARPAGRDRRQPDQRRAGAGGIQVSRSSICSCCSPRSPSTGWWGEIAWRCRPSTPDDMRRRRRGRNRRHADACCVALLRAVLCDHHREDDAVVAMRAQDNDSAGTPVRLNNRIVRRHAGRCRYRHGRRVVRGHPAVPRVLRCHRLWRHAADRPAGRARRDASDRSPSASTPT